MKQLTRLRHRIGEWLSPKQPAPPEPEQERPRLTATYSMVVPCYNVEEYIDAFFTSVFAQTVDPAGLEIVTVDDGSTDGTAARIRAWSDRYPGRIQYVHQINQGLSSARNTGLHIAKGDWVSFPDPDDFLAADYLEEVDKEVAQKRARPLVFISCYQVYFREMLGANVDKHSLRYLFAKDRTIKPASDLGNHIQFAVATAWLNRKLVEHHRLEFDRRVAPSFEDGHLINRLLLMNPEGETAFLKKPVYYYRKRADRSSLIDRSKLDKRWYLDQFRYGYLDLVSLAKATTGSVPRFIERTLLFDAFARFVYLVDYPERAAFLQPEERKEFLELLKSLFTHISAATIDTFELGKCHERHKVGMLNLMKQARRPVTTVYARSYDAAARLMELSYSSPDLENHATAHINGAEVELMDCTSRASTFLDQVYYVQHSFRVPIDTYDYLTVRVDGQISPIKCADMHLGAMVTSEQVRRTLRAHRKKSNSAEKG